MKKLLFGLCLLFATIVNSQYTIFSENMGGGSGTITIASNIFQNTNLTFSGTADTRSTTPSTTYAGASGSRNVFLTNTSGINFQISAISTVGLFNLKLSFGAYKSTTASTMSELILEYSTDGTTYTTISILTQPTGTGTASWRLISSISLPTATQNITNLRLRWRQTSTTTQFRLDDIKLTYETALPIELTEFTGYKTNEYNVLKWQTSSEHNNSHFILERSDTGEFTENDVIAIIDGAGNSTEIINYSYRDFDAPKKINYYRLSQVDFDGNFKQYGPISVDNRDNRIVIKYINLLGQEINSSTSGVLFEVYEDGSVKRVWRP